MDGSRYVIDIAVVSNAEKSLAAIANSAVSASSKIANMESSTSKTVEAMEGLGRTASAALGSMLSEKIQGVAESLDGLAAKWATSGREMVQSVYHDAATFEDLQSDMKFAFGESWESYFSKAESEAAKLTFSMSDVVRTISGLKRMKVDIFGNDLDNITTFKSKTGEMITALEVIQDASDAAGRDAQKMLFSFREAFSGDWKSLKDALDLPKSVTEEWQKAMDKGKDVSEKANILLTKVAEMYGGAGALRAENFNKTVQQLPDLFEQIRAKAGAAGLKEITRGMKQIVDALTELKNNKAVMDALSMMFLVIGKGVGAVLKAGAATIRWVGALVSAVPFLPMLLGGFAALAVAGMALAAVIASVAAAVIGFGMAVAAVEAEMLVPFLVILPLLVVAAGALIATIGAIGLVGTAAAQILTQNWGGVSDTFTNIKLVFSGFKELMDSYNGTTATMSGKTANALKGAGLFETVRELFMLFHRANVAWRSFQSGMMDFGEAVAPVFMPMMDELKALFAELAQALGLSSGLTDGARSSTVSWAEAGKAMVAVLVELTRNIITMIRVGVAIARVAVAFYTWADSSGALTASIWALKAVLFVLAIGVAAVVVPAMLVVAASVAMIAAPFLAAAAAVYALIKAYRVVSDMTKGGLSFDEAMKKNETPMPSLTKPLWGDEAVVDTSNKSYKPYNPEGATGSWAPGDKYYGKPLTQEEADAMNHGIDIGKSRQGGENYDEVYRRSTEQGPPLPPGMDKSGLPAGPPLPPAGGQDQQQGAQQVATAVQAQSGVLDGIRAALAAFNVTVTLDGAEIARAVNAAGGQVAGLGGTWNQEQGQQGVV